MFSNFKTCLKFTRISYSINARVCYNTNKWLNFNSIFFIQEQYYSLNFKVLFSIASCSKKILTLCGLNLNSLLLFFSLVVVSKFNNEVDCTLSINYHLYFTHYYFFDTLVKVKSISSAKN